MTRTRRILLLFLLAATVIANAETPSNASSDSKDAANRPAAASPGPLRWEFGPFANWGFGIGNRSSYKFFWAGAQYGRTVFKPVRAGIFSGQFELGGNVMPLWQAYTPAPHTETFHISGPGCPAGGCSSVAPVGGGTFRGVSVTPVILRWNFLDRSDRFKPWFQGAGGLIYTTHKFPPAQLVPKGTPGGTSVWNFTPQGGFGFHYFVHPKRSLDFGVNAVHVSSASLGDKNPGINASFQLQVGYSYWK